MGFAQLSVDDFSGGFTDYYMDNQINRYQFADNFIITANKKLRTRIGSTLFDSNHFTLLASGNPRPGATINFDKDTKLLVQISRNLYHTTGTWAALTGPVTGNVVFSQGTSTGLISWSEWNKHIFLADDQFSLPMKCYLDETSTFQVRNAGLQLLDLTGAVTLANQLKTKFNSHIADATGEHVAADTLNTTTSNPSYDLQTLITLVTELLTDYAAHRLDATLGSPIFHVATSSANALSSVAAPRTLTECLTRLDDLKIKINAHDNDATAHGATGNYQVTAIRYPSADPAGSGHNYVYKFHYYFTYQVGTVIFEDFGPTSDLSLSTTNVIAGGNPVTISNIPVLSNGSNLGSGNNYDTANIKIFIFRTIDNGTTFFKVAELTNGTTSYVDSTTDATLATAVTAYTTGGVVDNDQPPPAKYIHIINGYGYYAHIKEGSQILPNRVVQSIRDDPDSVPGDFFIDLDDEITGLSSVNSRLVAFTKKWAYRIEGFFDELGRGGLTAQKINDAAGCISHQGIVQTNSGLFYPGIDGMYYTDGFQVLKISTQWNDTYKAITSTTTKQKHMVGAYEEQNQRIYWSAQFSDSSEDNDKLLVLDLRFGIKPDSCFTTWSNGLDFAPTGLTFFNKELVRSDKRGYLLKHQDALDSDLKIDTAVTPTAWLKKTIIYNYTSIGTDFGSSQIRKFVNRIIFQAKNETNASVLIRSINDDYLKIKDLKEIRFRGNLIWGDPDIIWGDTNITYVWGSNAFLQALRRFPSGQLRCSYKQIQITNAFTDISKSDTLGTATVSASAKTVTLNNASSTWPADAVDYYISFATDNYVNNFLITRRNSNTIITYEDNAGISSSGSTTKWLLRGYIKGEKLHLLKYVYEFVPLTDSQEPFEGSAYLGENA